MNSRIEDILLAAVCGGALVAVLATYTAPACADEFEAWRQQILRDRDYEADLRRDSEWEPAPIDPSLNVWSRDGYEGAFLPNEDGSVYFMDAYPPHGGHYD